MTCNWIKNWLLGRTQKVIINGESSQEAAVLSGVPQGTVLGPLLFLIYINDIGKQLSCNFKLFADDCILLKEIVNQSDAIELQQDLDKLNTWTKLWQMKLNIKKCSILRICTKKKQLMYNYSIGNTKLECVKEQKYLGVSLKYNLKWSSNIDILTAKAMRSLNFVKRNLFNAPEELKEQAYFSFVRPILEYASTIWDPFDQIYIDKIERVQRKAARFVKNCYNPMCSVTKLLKDLKWQSLQERRFINRMPLLHRTIYDQCAVDIPDQFVVKDSRKNLKSSNTLNFPTCSVRTNDYKFSFFPRSTRAWNLLPDSTKLCPSRESFKSSLVTNFQNSSLILGNPKFCPNIVNCRQNGALLLY